jgi:hypothetical protein
MNITNIANMYTSQQMLKATGVNDGLKLTQFC